MTTSAHATSRVARRAAALATGLGLLVSSALAVATMAAPAQAAGLRSTTFGFAASGYATRAHGGQIPAGSDTTSFQAIGCTNHAGVRRENHLTQGTIPGAGTISTATTRIRTSAKDGVAAVRTRSHIEQLVMGDSSSGTVEIDAISAVVRAWHDGQGFHTSYNSSIGTITYTPSTGPSQQLPVPTAGVPVEIPGLIRLEIGADHSRQSSSDAHAAGYALLITMLASNTKVGVAHATGTISGNVIHGRFGGNSAGISSDALENNVSVGRQPLTIMRCQGTRGKVKHKSIADQLLDNGLAIQGLRSSQMGDQGQEHAFGQAIGQVSSFDLGGGQVTATTVKGVANVRRTDNGVRRNIKGSNIGSLEVNGQAQSFPPSDVIEVPGVVRLERNLVDKTKNGISVVALRMTMLDGSGAVIDLGVAKLLIKPAQR